jgi:hypothetical protein
LTQFVAKKNEGQKTWHHEHRLLHHDETSRRRKPRARGEASRVGAALPRQQPPTLVVVGAALPRQQPPTLVGVGAEQPQPPTLVGVGAPQRRPPPTLAGVVGVRRLPQRPTLVAVGVPQPRRIRAGAVDTARTPVEEPP